MRSRPVRSDVSELPVNAAMDTMEMLPVLERLRVIALGNEHMASFAASLEGSIRGLLEARRAELGAASRRLACLHRSRRPFLDARELTCATELRKI